MSLRKVIITFSPDFFNTLIEKSQLATAQRLLREALKGLTITEEGTKDISVYLVVETDATKADLKKMLLSALIGNLENLSESDFTVKIEDVAKKSSIAGITSFLDRYKNLGTAKKAEEKSSDENSEKQEGETETQAEAPTPENVQCVTKKSDILSTADAVMKEIDELVGVEEFKKLAKELYSVAPLLKQQKAEEAFSFQNYLFTVNHGYGAKHLAELLAKLISALGLCKFSACQRTKTQFITLPSDPRAFEEIIKALSDNSNDFYVLSIDISVWISKLNSTEFQDFLYRLYSMQSNFLYIFKVPYLENNVIRTILAALNNVLYVRALPIQPFTNKQFREIAEQTLKKVGLTAENSFWRMFQQRLAAEKNDGRFYGIKTVVKVTNELIYKKLLYNAQHNKHALKIKSKEIADFIPYDSGDYLPGLQALDDLIGMDSVKTTLKAILAQIKLALSQGKQLPCLHMSFVGSPGTGKTTVARLLGKILSEEKILANGYFFEHQGRDLCGEYVGQTAPKTAAICREAYGSVLFIDEAYALYAGSNSSSNDYGKEALATLISEMENHRKDMVVIFAGYKEEMEVFIKGNSGLSSRIPYLIEFPNFSGEELFIIFKKFADKEYSYTEEFIAAAKEFFMGLSEEFISAKEFSNARYVRNLFERVCSKAAVRLLNDPEEKLLLTESDFRNAISDNEFALSQEPKSKVNYGFII